VNVVGWDREPAAPVTVIVDDPVGVDVAVVRVTLEEHVGLHDAGEKEAVAPVGRPEAEKTGLASRNQRRRDRVGYGLSLNNRLISTVGSEKSRQVRSPST